jgi:hypothetical protein
MSKGAPRAGQLAEHGDHQMRRINFEVLPQRGTGVGATEPVGPERGVGAVDEPRHLVRHGAHVVGDRDHGVWPRPEHFGHQGPAGRFYGVETIPPLDLEGVVAQLAP